MRMVARAHEPASRRARSSVKKRAFAERSEAANETIATSLQYVVDIIISLLTEQRHTQQRTW